MPQLILTESTASAHYSGATGTDVLETQFREIEPTLG